MGWLVSARRRTAPSVYPVIATLRVISGAEMETVGKWSCWQSLSGSFTGDSMVGRDRDGRIEVCAHDKDGNVQFRVQREPAKSRLGCVVLTCER